MTHSSNADEADFTEGVLLMDTADDAVLEWSDSVYGEHSGFVDLPTGLLYLFCRFADCFFFSTV